MKKIFYIVLLAVILLVIGYFVKSQNNPVVANKPAVEEIATVNSNSQNNTAPGEEEPIMINNDTDSNAAGEAVDENIVEENPDQTSSDGETVIKEDNTAAHPQKAAEPAAPAENKPAAPVAPAQNEPAAPVAPAAPAE